MEKRNVLGFTLIEVIITITILGVLLATVITLLDPVKYLSESRDNERKTHLISILNVVGQRTAEKKGVFETDCASGAIPSVATEMATGDGNYDIAPCLVPTYLPGLPFDPKTDGAYWTTVSDYDTGYTIFRDAVTRRITVSAPGAELEIINYTR